MKRCAKCLQDKDDACFQKRSASKDGLYSYCKACSSEYMSTWRAKNPERARASRKASAKRRPPRNAKNNRNRQRRREGLSDAYIRERLKRTSGLKEAPQPLIDAIRANLRLKRLIWSKSNEQNQQP